MRFARDDPPDGQDEKARRLIQRGVVSTAHETTLLESLERGARLRRQTEEAVLALDPPGEPDITWRVQLMIRSISLPLHLGHSISTD